MAQVWSFPSLLFCLDVFCLTSWGIIRSMRARTDDDDRSIFPPLPLFQRVQDVTSTTWIAVRDFLQTSGETNTFWANCKSCLKATLFNNVRKHYNQIVVFEGWKPIPYKMNLIINMLVLILLTVFLDKNIFLKGVGLETKPTTEQLCKANDGYDAILNETKKKLEIVTNAVDARDQYNYAMAFRDALNSDIELFGTEGYMCKGKSKMDWKKESSEPYFTGWCEKWKQVDLDEKKTQTCELPKTCETACAKIIVRACGILSATACIGPKEYPCPPNNLIDEEIQLYKYAQQKIVKEEKVEKLKENMNQVIDTALEVQDEGVDYFNILMRQIELISYIYVGYLFVQMFFPVPIILFKSPKSIKMKRVIFGFEQKTFILSGLLIWWGYQYFQAFWFNPSISMYFKNMINNPCYVDQGFIEAKNTAISSLCLEMNEKKNEFSLIKEEIETDLYKGDFVYDTCACDLPIESLSDFLFYDAKYYGEEYSETYAKFKNIGLSFRNAPIKFTSYVGGFYIPTTATDFVANTTVCTDPEYARREFHEAPETSIDWFAIFVSTGFFGQMLAKIVLANFWLSLFREADPLGLYSGKLESPNDQYFINRNTHLNDLQNDSTFLLKTMARRDCVIWGTLTHLLIFNLVFSAVGITSSPDYVADTTDIVVATVSLSLAVFTPLLGILFKMFLARKIFR